MTQVAERRMRYLRTLGWVDGFLYVLKRLLNRLSGHRVELIKYHVVAQPVRTSRWLAGRRGKDINVRSVRLEEPAFGAFPRPSGVLRARFDQGAECLAAFRDDRPVGFIWFTLNDYEEDEVRCLFRPHPPDITAWDFDVYVAPEDRIGPTFLKLWDELNHCLRERGVRWSLSRIDAFNVASRSAHRRLGATVVNWLVFVTCGTWQIMIGSHPGRRLHVSRAPRRPLIEPSVHDLDGDMPASVSGD